MLFLIILIVSLLNIPRLVIGFKEENPLPAICLYVSMLGISVVGFNIFSSLF